MERRYPQHAGSSKCFSTGGNVTLGGNLSRGRSGYLFV